MNKNVGKAPQGAEGVITRGKTAQNRLRRVDVFLSLYAADLIKQPTGAFIVDLGYGDEAVTVIEMAQRLRRLNSRLPVLGVEIDPERVERARPFSDELTQFRLGGFNLPLTRGESVRIIRAYNVLRQYPEEEVIPAWKTMAQAVQTGGLIIEGTSDPYGKILTANLLRVKNDGLWYEGLLFSTNFRWGFSPEIFQPVLPKNFIHRMLPGETIYQFMEDWKRACLETVAYRQFGLRQWFNQSAERLHAFGYSILLQKRYLDKGCLLWRMNQAV